ncbi:MAG: pirin family protein [Nitrospinota bacterium]|nr:pirin family protein [Nitrospinota bacterium]
MDQRKRTVVNIAEGVRTSDGAGVRLTRIIGSGRMMDLDPFLLFDEFKSDNPDDYIGGFPDHPHRGFETVTYLIAGVVDHADSAGNSGTLQPGGAQWMTAGRGLVHSELPKQKEGLLWGFQLWVNLPADSKMAPPRYQDITPEAIPHAQLPDGVVARVLAGQAFGVTGPVEGIVTIPLYIDISLPPNTSISVPVEDEKSAFVYMAEGEGEAGGTALAAGTLGQLSKGDSVELAAGSSGCRVFVVAAKPLNEPVARWGPFVMNTDEEIEQAIQDYRAGRIRD